MKIIKTVCDIEKCNSENCNERKIQCIRTTDTTEGRPCNRYFETNKIDICEDCYSELLRGGFIIVYGAQGYNSYELYKREK